MALLDPHSYADSDQPRTRHLALDLVVDFTERRLAAEVTLHFASPSSGPLDLDSKGLSIRSVTTPSGATVPHTLGPADPILGERLRLELPPGTSAVTIAYTTSPDATALQWLEPAQTAGRRHPFLFSQCQAIHARSMVQVQDTARLGGTYEAAGTLAGGLVAVMSAGPEGVRPGPRPGTTTFLFRMPQAIPTSLLALAAGHLEGRDLSPRSRVWAEPEVVEAAAWEFAGIEEMIAKAERLFGPYEWDRYDMLVLPPSFPYGGMENPRMTFLTPTLLAGDRSLVDVVAHELAHSWTGNLVTNASAEHFWLNEGFTVFAERRILEALEGPEEAALHAALGRRSLETAIEHFRAHPHLTALRTHLTGIDPDDVFSQVPYEKGYLLLCAMEAAAGRPAFDKYLRKYIDTFRFKALTTEDWVAFTERELPGVLAKVNGEAYLHQPGIPASAPSPRSRRLEELQRLMGTVPSEEAVKEWTPSEWQ